MMLASIGGAELFMLLALPVAFGFILLGFAFWVWMLIDAIRNPALTDGERVAWVLVILFLHCLGALIYFFVGRSRRVMRAA